MNYCLQYPRPITEQYTKELQQSEGNTKNGDSDIIVNEEALSGDPSDDPKADARIDSPDVPMRFSEKKRLHWKGLTCA